MNAPAPQLPPGAKEPEGEVRLTFMEHLRDLRQRLKLALMGLAVGMAVIGYWVPELTDGLLRFVREALPEDHQNIKYLTPVEPLMVYFKVAMYGGLFVAAPWVLYQLWQFVAPGLYKKEKKVVVPFLIFGTLLFYAGAAFCYWLVMPQAFPAMLAVASPNLEASLTLDQTFGLALAMLLGFGVVFEVPVVIAFLAMIGLVNWKTLAKYRRIAIVVNVVAAAIITPTGDPINLALMAIPMILFYEIGIILARILGKKDQPEPAT
ncbi:MAG: twin-arginine translocase subunit TatC [Anaeromyxobacter sp.]